MAETVLVSPPLTMSALKSTVDQPKSPYVLPPLNMFRPFVLGVVML